MVTLTQWSNVDHSQNLTKTILKSWSLEKHKYMGPKRLEEETAIAI